MKCKHLLVRSLRSGWGRNNVRYARASATLTIYALTADIIPDAVY